MIANQDAIYGLEPHHASDPLHRLAVRFCLLRKIVPADHRNRHKVQTSVVGMAACVCTGPTVRIPMARPAPSILATVLGTFDRSGVGNVLYLRHVHDVAHGPMQLRDFSP